MTEIINEKKEKTADVLPWDKPNVAKKDFVLIPLYLLSIHIVPIVIFAIIYAIAITLNIKNETMLDTHVIGVFGSIMAEIIIIISFVKLYPKVSFIKLSFNRFKQVPRYILMIIATYIVIIFATPIYEWLITFFPKSFQYGVTQNQLNLEQLFDKRWMYPFLFIDIVILTPFVEELIFRHLIIHELGKKITYGLATLLSIIIFASIHVINASSPFEIGGYLIISIGLSLVYLKSGENLAVAITLHSLINFVSFITIICS